MVSTPDDRLSQKTLSCPTNLKSGLFAQKQVIGQKRRGTNILRAPSTIRHYQSLRHIWYKQIVIVDKMFLCIMIHNMIIEDEWANTANWIVDPKIYINVIR